MDLEQFERRRARGVAALELLGVGVALPKGWQLGVRDFSRDLRWGCAETGFGRVWLGGGVGGISRIAFSEVCPWLGRGESRDDVWAVECAGLIFREVRQAGEMLLVRGTSFELRVWGLLCAIPEGAVVTYGDLAKALGKPGACRAVGQAVGRNEHAWLIPCHRVIGESGKMGGFRWGVECKVRFLAWEEGVM